MGLATVKRWLAGNALTIARLEEMCGLAGIALSDLVAEADAKVPSKLLRLTISQERALASDGRLTFLFFSILNGWPPSDFAREFGVDLQTMAIYLERLERLGLIDRLTGERIRPLAARQVAWRRGGPLARHFEARVKHLFFETDFGHPDTAYVSDVAKLSPNAVARIERLTEQFRLDVHRIAAEDRNLPGERGWIAVLVVVQPLEPATMTFAAHPGAPE